jgi:hypothetical protein
MEEGESERMICGDYMYSAPTYLKGVLDLVHENTPRRWERSHRLGIIVKIFEECIIGSRHHSNIDGSWKYFVFLSLILLKPLDLMHYHVFEKKGYQNAKRRRYEN